jgi:U4/U6.U5 tri-snRNP-associated protein 2
VEKNPTLVTFPVRGLELRDTLPLPSGCPSTYDLVANVVHEGKPGEGAFRAQVLHRADSLWYAPGSRLCARPCAPRRLTRAVPAALRYEAQDLSVAEVLPQQVALSEALLLVYERRK